MIDVYGFDTEVISASIRHPLHVVDSMNAGCHIATIPYDVLREDDEAPAHRRRHQEVLRRLPEDSEALEATEERCR